MDTTSFAPISAPTAAPHPAPQGHDGAAPASNLPSADPAPPTAAGRRPASRRRIKTPKAASAALCTRLEQLPNIGPSIAADLRRIGIERPADLHGRDAFALYRALCLAAGQRQDPCVLDTFMAAVDFIEGAPARPWWQYTARRKALFGVV